MFFPDNLRYTENHQWLQSDGHRIRIGLTVYAEHQAGTVSFFEFPELGKRVKEGEELCLLETVKAAVSIRSPVTGVVSRVNSDLDENPLLFHVDPFQHWLVELTIDGEYSWTEAENRYLTAAEYERLLREETQ